MTTRYSDLAVLAIVTARGGSKGLPGKNIRMLCGRPLIQWSIDTALSCDVVDSVVVSTDDHEIARLSADAGAEVPFLRPPSLSGDTSCSVDVVIHALDFLSSKGRVFDIVLLLEPTSPLREDADICLALQKMVDVGASSVVSVCKAESSHPDFMFRINDSNRLDPFVSSPSSLRRQDILPLFYPDGSIYISTVSSLRKRRSFYHEDTVAYEVNKWKSFEIDDIEDFEIVESIAKHRGMN